MVNGAKDVARVFNCSVQLNAAPAADLGRQPGPLIISGRPGNCFESISSRSGVIFLRCDGFLKKAKYASPSQCGF